MRLRVRHVGSFRIRGGFWKSNEFACSAPRTTFRPIFRQQITCRNASGLEPPFSGAPLPSCQTMQHLGPATCPPPRSTPTKHPPISSRQGNIGFWIPAMPPYARRPMRNAPSLHSNPSWGVSGVWCLLLAHAWEVARRVRPRRPERSSFEKPPDTVRSQPEFIVGFAPSWGEIGQTSVGFAPESGRFRTPLQHGIIFGQHRVTLADIWPKTVCSRPDSSRSGHLSMMPTESGPMLAHVGLHREIARRPVCVGIIDQRSAIQPLYSKVLGSRSPSQSGWIKGCSLFFSGPPAQRAVHEWLVSRCVRMRCAKICESFVAILLTTPPVAEQKHFARPDCPSMRWEGG